MNETFIFVSWATIGIIVYLLIMYFIESILIREGIISLKLCNKKKGDKK